MRASGILLHISSLPSPHGIGTMGAAAKDFVDFLVKAGQAYWQILPVCPTSYGDPAAAQKTFERFRKCTEVYLRCFQSGTPITRLAVAV